MAPDYATLAKRGVSAEALANMFLEEHFAGAEPEYPLNPFQILKECGVVFSFRPFDKYEGLYIPCNEPGDVPVVGINLKRPITRQRYTAAHELCHHLKDANSGVVCPINARSKIERYAENFAAALLMPRAAMARQIALRGENGKVSLDDVLQIAAFFGVSFSACLNRVAFDFHALKGNPSLDELKKLKKTYRPGAKREALGLTDEILYKQLLDSAEEMIKIEMDPAKRQRFETNYIYHDSRMEGIKVSKETAAEIVVDLRLNGKGSKYCSEENINLIEVAGLAVAYNYAFDCAVSTNEVTVYDAKTFNKELFSLAPHPEYGGRFRESNTLVLGAKFETADYKSIPAELLSAGKDLDALLAKEPFMTASEYVEAVVKFHHRLTVLHPFRDGNGRSTRGFANILFVRRGLPPVLFLEKDKAKYKNALAIADKTGNYGELFCLFCSQMFSTYAVLTDVAM